MGNNQKNRSWEEVEKSRQSLVRDNEELKKMIENDWKFPEGREEPNKEDIMNFLRWAREEYKILRNEDLPIKEEGYYVKNYLMHGEATKGLFGTLVEIRKRDEYSEYISQGKHLNMYKRNPSREKMEEIIRKIKF